MAGVALQSDRIDILLRLKARVFSLLLIIRALYFIVIM